jgi:hypothetical protein
MCKVLADRAPFYVQYTIPMFSLRLDLSSVVIYKTFVVCYNNGFCFHNNFRTTTTKYLISLEWNEPQLS